MKYDEATDTYITGNQTCYKHEKNILAVTNLTFIRFDNEFKTLINLRNIDYIYLFDNQVRLVSGSKEHKKKFKSNTEAEMFFYQIQELTSVLEGK